MNCKLVDNKPTKMKYLFVLSLIIMCVQSEDWFKDATSAVKGATCLISVSPKLTSDCVNDFNRELESRPEDEKKSKVCLIQAFDYYCYKWITIVC